MSASWLILMPELLLMLYVAVCELVVVAELFDSLLTQAEMQMFAMDCCVILVLFVETDAPMTERNSLLTCFLGTTIK